MCEERRKWREKDEDEDTASIWMRHDDDVDDDDGLSYIVVVCREKWELGRKGSVFWERFSFWGVLDCF